jgi:hypothetical protein
MPKHIYQLTRLITEGDWGDIVKPVIKDYVEQEKNKENKATIIKLMRFKRIIVVKLIDKITDEMGLQRTLESTQSHDRYTVIIKGGNEKDANEIFTQMRKILIEVPTKEFYNRIVMPNPGFTPKRGGWETELDIIAYKAGKGI